MKKIINSTSSKMRNIIGVSPGNLSKGRFSSKRLFLTIRITCDGSQKRQCQDEFAKKCFFDWKYTSGTETDF